MDSSVPISDITEDSLYKDEQAQIITTSEDSNGGSKYNQFKEEKIKLQYTISSVLVLLEQFIHKDIEADFEFALDIYQSINPFLKQFEAFLQAKLQIMNKNDHQKNINDLGEILIELSSDTNNEQIDQQQNSLSLSTDDLMQYQQEQAQKQTSMDSILERSMKKKKKCAEKRERILQNSYSNIEDIFKKSEYREKFKSVQQNRWECIECGKYINGWANCSQHWCRQHAKDRFLCQQCKCVLSCLTDLVTHIFVHHNNDVADSQIQCAFCPRILNTRKTYRPHLIMKHKQEIEPMIQNYLNNQSQHNNLKKKTKYLQ